ncbi:MAG TPA: hypothetical protein VE778_00915 [Candidatus Bathyarchaeia archaeon]|jgi:hypothetical protein|nr:hypothetical protein [Candidatus Bathyarchaeia archaeon]
MVKATVECCGDAVNGWLGADVLYRQAAEAGGKFVGVDAFRAERYRLPGEKHRDAKTAKARGYI